MMARLAQCGRARQWRNALLLVLLGFLTACGGGTSRMGDLLSDSPQSRPGQAAPATPETPVAHRIALLLPLTAPGETQAIAKALQNAAELANKETGGAPFLVKDTGGSSDMARTQAQAALDEGASLIIGPVLSTEVQAVTPVAQARGVPVIAFSSVSAVAAPGTYLMSFLPEEEVSNILRYAAGKGLNAVVLLYPTTQYGKAVADAASQSLAATGGNLAAQAAYAREPAAVAVPVAKVATAAKAPQSALLLPEGGQMLRSISLAAVASGINPRKTKVLGTGLWDDVLTRNTPIAMGGWYAGVAPLLVQQFDQKYQQAYGSKPPRIASLAYDAVKLANQLSAGGDMSSTTITNPQGFTGANGLYRFRANGTIERALAIMEMGPGGPGVIQPAPARF
jgi:ABC-type branched-subunit amino acid transport system substrate-binding protein